MSAEPATRPRESIFAIILLFPLRAIERARGWRRLGLLLVYVMIALPIAALLWRRSQLAGLPDVGEIYDGSIAASRAPAADDRNAFVLYLRATERFSEMKPDAWESFSKANLVWTRADAVLRRWVAEHQEAISQLRAGSERPEASLELPGRPAGRSAPSRNRKSSGVCRGSAMRRSSRLDGCKPKATLSALEFAQGRHPHQPEHGTGGASVWCRGTATTLALYAVEPVSAWAKDHSVSLAQLQSAPERDRRRRGASRPTFQFLSRGIPGRPRFAGESEPADRRASASRATGGPGPLAFAPNLDTFLRGEPERTRRVLHLLAANDLAWCDRSVGERPEFAIPKLRIYQTDPTAPGRTKLADRGARPVGRVDSDQPGAPLAHGRAGEV